MNTSTKDTARALTEARGIHDTLAADLVTLREKLHELDHQLASERRGGADPERLTTLAGRSASLRLLVQDQTHDVEQAARAVEQAEEAHRDATEAEDAKRAREAYEQAVKTRQDTVDEAVDAVFREAARIHHVLKAENAALHKHDPVKARTSRVRAENGVRRALAGLNPKFGQALATIIDSAASLSQRTSAERRELEAEKKAAHEESERQRKARQLRERIDERVAIMNARGSSPAWDDALRKELADLEALGETYDDTALPAAFTRQAAA